MVDLRFLLLEALSGVLPQLTQKLNFADLQYNGTDDDLLRALADSIQGSVSEIPGRIPTPLPRHEECLECDSLILIHQRRSSWDDPETGVWVSHCDVCWEVWPCPEANELDEEEVEALRARFRVLQAAFTGGDIGSHPELRRVRLRLQAENQLHEGKP